MKKILVATDFSTAALHAAVYAADMAAAIDATLYLLHVYPVVVPYGAIPVLSGGVDMEIAEQHIQAFKKQIAERSDHIPIETNVTVGVFFEELKNVCERIQPYAVVMGSQGTSAAERFFLGSHTVYALQHLHWPLITVPPEVKFSAVKKIGLACDLKDVAATIPVEEITLLVKDLKAEFHIINTGRHNLFDAEAVFEAGLLGEMTRELAPQYHFVNSDHVDEGILEFVEKNHMDMLILLPKSHSLVDTLLHSSHTKHLMLSSPVPVITLHK